MGWLEGGTAILAFRGTQTAQDGLQDVKIVRQSIDHLQGMFPGTQAHSGETHRHCVMFALVLGMGGYREWGDTVYELAFEYDAAYAIWLHSLCQANTCLAIVIDYRACLEDIVRKGKAVYTAGITTVAPMS